MCRCQMSKFFRIVVAAIFLSSYIPIPFSQGDILPETQLTDEKQYMSSSGNTEEEQQAVVDRKNYIEANWGLQPKSTSTTSTTAVSDDSGGGTNEDASSPEPREAALEDDSETENTFDGTFYLDDLSPKEFNVSDMFEEGTTVLNVTPFSNAYGKLEVIAFNDDGTPKTIKFTPRAALLKYRTVKFKYQISSFGGPIRVTGEFELKVSKNSKA